MNIKGYIGYGWYLAKHRWFVFVECCKLGIPWLGIIHDWSKLRPSEFIPYANYFYPNGVKRLANLKLGYSKPVDSGDAGYEWAWLLHQKRNRHHWQFWVVPRGDGTNKVLDMPSRYLREMVADWRGAGRAYGNTDTIEWYEKNKNRIVLHPETEKKVEEYLRLR